MQPPDPRPSYGDLVGDPPTPKDAATTALVTPEVLAGFLAEMAAQEVPVETAVPLAEAFFKEYDRYFREKIGPLPWVRRTIPGRVLAITGKTCTVQCAGLDDPVTGVLYGPTKPTVGDTYPVRFPVALPPEGQPLAPGPVPYGQPWIKVGGGVALYYGVVVPIWPPAGGPFDPHGNELRVYRAAWPPDPQHPETDPALLVTVPPIVIGPAEPHNPPPSIAAYLVGVDSGGTVYVAWPTPQRQPDPHRVNPDGSVGEYSSHVENWVPPHPITNEGPNGSGNTEAGLQNQRAARDLATPHYPCQAFSSAEGYATGRDVPIPAAHMPWWVDLTPGQQKIALVGLELGVAHYHLKADSSSKNQLSGAITTLHSDDFRDQQSIFAVLLGYLEYSPTGTGWSVHSSVLRLALHAGGMAPSFISNLSTISYPYTLTLGHGVEGSGTRDSYPYEMTLAHFLNLRLWTEDAQTRLAAARAVFDDPTTSKATRGPDQHFAYGTIMVATSIVGGSYIPVPVGTSGAAQTMAEQPLSATRLVLDGALPNTPGGVHPVAWAAGAPASPGAAGIQVAAFGVRPYYEPVQSADRTTLCIARVGGSFGAPAGFPAGGLVAQDRDMTALILHEATEPPTWPPPPPKLHYTLDGGMTWQPVPYPGQTLPHVGADGVRGNAVIV